MANVFDFIKRLGLMGYIKILVPMDKIKQQWKEECNEYHKKYVNPYSESSNKKGK